MRKIMNEILKEFSNSEKKLKIAKTLLENGLRINEKGEIYLRNIRIPYQSIARATSTDRRTVKETIEKIKNHPELYPFYKNLTPAGPFLRDIAKTAGYRVLTIEVHHDQPGIIAHVAKILSDKNINILQTIAEYPDLYENPRLYVIIEGNIKGNIIEKIMEHGAIKSVKID